MKAASLKKAIERLGGTAKIVNNGHGDNVEGILNGHDIHMSGNNGYDIGFYTVRAISKRGTYDAGSDYNSGDYTFCEKINQLAWACDIKETPKAPAIHKSWAALQDPTTKRSLLDIVEKKDKAAGSDWLARAERGEVMRIM